MKYNPPIYYYNKITLFIANEAFGFFICIENIFEVSYAPNIQKLNKAHPKSRVPILILLKMDGLIFLEI